MSTKGVIHSPDAGFSLIEILVTTVVFSVGILGVAGLNAVSKRASFEAVQRSTASELAYSLLENMRSNSAVLATYVAAGTLGRGSLGSEPACADASACTAAEFAANSLWEWERTLDGGKEQSASTDTGGLLSPSACITGPADGTAGDYTVTIVWRGTSVLTDTGGTACGGSSGLYGATNEFRRFVAIQSYIDPSL